MADGVDQGRAAENKLPRQHQKESHNRCAPHAPHSLLLVFPLRIEEQAKQNAKATAPAPAEVVAATSFTSLTPLSTSITTTAQHQYQIS